MCHTPIHLLSDPTRGIARNNYAFLLQRLTDKTQCATAAATGVSTAKISRLVGSEDKQGDLELFAIMCAFLGIKLVDIEAVFCDRDMAQAMATMLRTSVNSPDFIDIIFSGETRSKWL